MALGFFFHLEIIIFPWEHTNSMINLYRPDHNTTSAIEDPLSNSASFLWKTLHCYKMLITIITLQGQVRYVAKPFPPQPTLTR